MSRVREAAARANALARARSALIVLGGCPAPIPTQPDPELRRVHCRHYTICLDLAFGHGWDGFGCGACMAFEGLTRDEERADLEAMEGLLRAVGGRLPLSGAVDFGCEVSE